MKSGCLKIFVAIFILGAIGNIFGGDDSKDKAKSSDNIKTQTLATQQNTKDTKKETFVAPQTVQKQQNNTQTYIMFLVELVMTK